MLEVTHNLPAGLARNDVLDRFAVLQMEQISINLSLRHGRFLHRLGYNPLQRNAFDALNHFHPHKFGMNLK